MIYQPKIWGEIAIKAGEAPSNDGRWWSANTSDRRCGWHPFPRD
jgi:hypothetical protein